jgi:hypothetical protein
MKTHRAIRILVLLFAIEACFAQAAFPSPPAPAQSKPNLWVYSDLSDPRDRRKGGHPQNDPDDICTLAALLLQANRFNIQAVVYSSNHRVGLKDATDFIQTTFAAAYAHDVPYLNQAFGGYQPEIPFFRSCVNRDGKGMRFDPTADYRDISAFDTVRALVDYASKNQVFVLNWGPSTEPAIAVQHCLTTGNTTALKNMTIISHWTMSYIAQGTPEHPYKVANCHDDASACDFLHQTAKINPLVKFLELGSIGQNGIVDGSKKHPRFAEFQQSRLGQIFIHSKFYNGAPDQSDGSTFWIIEGRFGPSLADVKTDGTMTQSIEEKNRDLFKANGHKIIDELLLRSNAAAQARNPFPGTFIAERFVYVYQFLNGRYYIYTALPASYEIKASDGNIVMKDSLSPGNHTIDDFAKLPVGNYHVIVTSGGITRQFALERPAK